MTNDPQPTDSRAIIHSMESLAAQPLGAAELDRLASLLDELSRNAEADGRSELQAPCEFVGQLIEIAACSDSQSDNDGNDVSDFIQQCLPIFSASLDDPPLAAELFEGCVSEARQRWSDYLVLEPSNATDEWLRTDDDSQDSFEEETAADSDTTDQIDLVLSALSSLEPSDDQAAPVDPSDEPIPDPPPSNANSDCEILQDKEMLEAYLDDANRCLASMEEAALSFEKNPTDHEALRQFCRELHTLKGASGSVGLNQLATFLHDLEEKLEKNDGQKKNPDELFAAVDAVRNQITSLSNQDPQPNAARPESVPTSAITEGGPSDEGSIRIRASQVERLMDMLAELVVLRNRRDSHLSDLHEMNDELTRCSTRLTLASQQLDESGAVQGSSSAIFQEIAGDIAAVSRDLKMLHKPIGIDNKAISEFIGHFRHQLMQLNRLPVGGLFKRLQRGARDAAKTEQKQIQIERIGDDMAIEQSIQERLYDPMLHLVRNAVSHGIECSEKRVACGKPEMGTVTIEARANPNLIQLEVRDDGGGLDYTSLRRKAQEKGLLPTHRAVSDHELAQVIFQPGFSTRDQATEVSGRGVGMDVVASAIQKLNGRIDVDSVLGQGTTMRISIPLRSGIEHVMVFTSGDQRFAVPMRSVSTAKRSPTVQDEKSLSSFAAVLGLKPKTETQGDVLFIGQRQSKIAILVDSIVGPEEVVVRSLPPTLEHHPLFCGITLSGAGEIVLLLDSEKLSEACQHHNASAETPIANSNSLATTDPDPFVLIVDDSLSARKSLVKKVNRLGFATREAADGFEALELLRKIEVGLLLTDLDMPRLGGLELLDELSNGEFGEFPKIVVSSRNRNDVLEKVLEAGAVDYLNKPVSDEALWRTIEQLGLGKALV